MRQLAKLILLVGVLAGTATAQSHRHGVGHHGMWSDSLEIVTLNGTAIVDTTHVMPMYYLDTDGDGQADYHLSFGPFWYEPDTGAERPRDGDVVTIQGARWGNNTFPVVVVFEINGLIWRDPVEGGMRGWDGDHFWGGSDNTLTVTGTLIIDSTYFYVHYFLDEDNDGVPDYMLSFGPPWYLLFEATELPGDGDEVTVRGNMHAEGMMGLPTIMVYDVDGEVWRNEDGPPPWSGNWIHRNAVDTSWVYCPTDSLDWMSHPPGSMMGMMMGGGMYPDSVYCQLEEIHPDFLPGDHDSMLFAGYYMNMYRPDGQTMMGMMGGRSMMRFNRPTYMHFHYDDDQIGHMNGSEEHIQVKAWDESTGRWIDVNNHNVDIEKNSITFQSEEMFTYYVLFSMKTATGIDDFTEDPMIPENFILYQNYPNPFNPETAIRFFLEGENRVNLTVYDLLGNKIITLIDGIRQPGSHEIVWNSLDDMDRGVASGVYFIKLTIGNQTQVRRMTLLK